MAAGMAMPFTPRRVAASETHGTTTAAKAVLYDATRCIGCRECIVGCAEENGWDADLAFGPDLKLTDTCLTYLQKFEPADEAFFLKRQCMHCSDPACVSACMLGAMHKDADGAVVWNADLCVGCRYCQIACPFNVPRFEWDSPLPSLRKCQMCPDRRAQGLPPACVAQCRRDALMFGPREEMLAEAHTRIEAEPEKYNRHVYGETDGGGTGVLYLTRGDASFASLGLPDLGDVSPADLPESIQHRLYKGFIAPIVLFTMLGAVVRRNFPLVHANGHSHDVHEQPAPVGGRLLTFPVIVLATLVAIGVAGIVWRLVAGLGATTNLNDGYPMGLWIAFDVVTGTALACGGYAMALLVYVANRGRYHPLIRPALVTSAFGYSLGGLSVLIDIGRPWNFYKIPTFFGEWNFNSILLEVALCIMLYTMVLWIEVSPIFLDRCCQNGTGRVKSFALKLSPKLEKILPYAIALGLLLPTMHQSSLGSLMLLAGTRLHPLWHTPLLPLLFLISCVGMGYAVVTVESTLSARAFGLPSETKMLRGLAAPAGFVLLAYAVVRGVDVVLRDKLELVTRMDAFSQLFLTEIGLFIVAGLGLLAFGRIARVGVLFTIAVAVILAGSLYRFSTYLIAFDPGPQWSYFPAIPEFAVTIGLIAGEILGYILLVKRFPVLRGAPRPEDAPSVSVIAGDDAWTEPVVNLMEERSYAPDEP
jgi:Ni/Fe-hydrogenase subunit HybB-like protein/Fe-S-cluster-containing dehydrogenase component